MKAPAYLPNTQRTLSRRSFLQLGGLGLLGLFAPPRSQQSPSYKKKILPLFEQINTNPSLALDQAVVFSRGANLTSNQLSGAFQQDGSVYPMGRVLDNNIPMFETPSFDAKVVKYLWLDSLVSISDVTIRDDTPSHNLVWYRIGEEGFVHSASIQPVRTVVNEPVADIPEGGNLAELTVPYTDARWGPTKNQIVAYRYYYGTTYWVIKQVVNDAGEPWYAVLDDKWDFTYYVPAQHLRLVPDSELQPSTPNMPDILKRLEVHLPEQLLIAYEMDLPVFMARVATGGKFRDGNFPTPTGRFMTFHKMPSRHMAAGNLAAGGYDLPGVPWISYFTESGISFHGTYWHNNFGRPRSHGCVNLTPLAAKWVYLWTSPVVAPREKKVYKYYGTALDVVDD